MAKIDTSIIEGYGEMTPEEKLKALEALDLPEPDYSGYVKKDVLDKATHDAAEWKRKYRAQLDDDQQKLQEREEQFEAMKGELEALKHEKAVSSYTAKYIAQGYKEDLAAATAEAMASGDIDTVFANNKKFLTEYEKSLKAELLKKTPVPDEVGSGSEKPMTKEKFQKLSYKEQLDYKASHPDWKDLK